MVSRYGPVKQDLCLLPPPPHYRVQLPPRADYAQGSYVQGPGNQGANQGPGSLRGIPSQPVPSSTPPNAEIKVQSLPQQTINPQQLMFPQPVRQPQQFYPRSGAPSNQNPRMASHNNRPQQPIFPQQIYPVHQQQVYIPGFQYSASTGRQNYVPTLPVFPTQHFQFQQTPQNLQYYYPMVPRTGTIQPPPPVTPTPPQPTLQMPIVANNTQHQAFPKNTVKQRRANALKIIDPNTGVDKMDEILGESSHPPSGESSARQTPQPSNQSSINKEVQATFAKQVLQAIGSDDPQRLHDEDDHTHQPPHHHPHHQNQMPPPHTPSVTSLTTSNLQHPPPGLAHLNQDVNDHHNFQTPPPSHLQQPPPLFAPQPHIEQHQSQLNQYTANPQIQISAQTSSVVVPPLAIINSTPAPVASSNVPNCELSLDQIVKSSTFNAMAKEFVLAPSSSSSINTAKETTPVVSALCDAEEVTLPPKLHKDRESPSKGRKYKEHLQQKISASSAPSAASLSSEHHHQHLPPIASSLDSDEKTTKSKDSSSSSNTTNLPQVVSKEVIIGEMAEPKKVHKKEAKVEQKSDFSETIEQQIQQTPVAVQQETVVSHAKPKQNARNASKQGGQQQPQQQNSHHNNNYKTSVPQSQPPKSSNKSHKKIDINQKGANKEGTDMDAFNDNKHKEIKDATVNNNAASTNDHLNANSNSISMAAIVNNNKNHVNNYEINNKNVGDSNNVTSLPNDINNGNNSTTIKSTTGPPRPTSTAKPKTNRVDVTSIVREQPKVSTKPLVVPQPLSNVTNNSTDETDRAVNPGVDILNANKSTSNTVSDNTAPPKINNELKNKLQSNLHYQEGQWSPTNPNGSKVYDKDFLLALKDNPNSKVKPDNIPDSVALDDRARLVDGRGSMGGRTDFNPLFNSYGGGGKSGSQRGNGPKRNSSQSKQGMGSGIKNMKPTAAKVSISLREDVKLHEAENAWRPARFNVGDSATEDDRKTELLYKKVRGILNKLTPQKFDTLLSRIKDLDIDNSERLQGVIDLIFDKAVDEPNFSVAYARMCKELALMQVKCATNEKVEIINFRKILITRCQMEFEKQSFDETTRNTKLKEIDECTDPEKKKELQFDLEEYDRKLRMKSVGNVRFIGELFKQEMLTVNIMLRCLHNLLDNKDEESLECLCKLLSTVGKELENHKHAELVPIFNTMKSIADKKDGKLSSRIRFMLQDVLDLKAAKWVPRRQDLNPKTIDQIQKEAEREQMNIQIMNSAPMPPRKDDRMGGGSGGSMSLDRKSVRGGRNVTEDGWTLSNQRNRNSPFVVQTDKFKNKAPLVEEPFGSMASFQNWSKGSQGLKSSSQITNTSNMYSALDGNLMDSDKRGSNRSKDSYSSKGPSLDRNYNKYDGRGSRSGSQHRSNDSSNSSSQRSTTTPVFSASMGGPPPNNRLAPTNMGPPATAAPISTSSAVAPSTINAPTPTVSVLTEEQMERSTHNSLDEYINGNIKVDEYFQAISSCIPQTEYCKVVMWSYLRVFEKSQNNRLKTGELFAKLVKQGQIHKDDYCAGVEEILAQADDLKIDIPKFWDYLTEILVDIVSEEVLSLSRLLELSKKLISPNDISKLLACLFKLIVSKKGPVCLQQLWQKSGLRFADFLDSSCIQNFVNDNQLEFLVEGKAPVGKQEELPFDDIQEQLLYLLRQKANHDEIFNWITDNVGERVKENKFIRALSTAIFEDSISSSLKLQKLVLTNHSNLLLKYIDNKSIYELEGLYALQALIHKLEHPQGLLLEICTTLLDSLMFSQESFVTWEQSNDPSEQEGKGVALKQLTAFITQLKENDDDDDDDQGSSADDA